jgi:hypothetical protein
MAPEPDRQQQAAANGIWRIFNSLAAASGKREPHCRTY